MPVRLALLPVAVEYRAVWQCLDALPVELAVLPLAVVLLAVAPVVAALAVGFVVRVLAFVARLVRVYALALAVPLSEVELPLVHVPVGPGELSEAVRVTFLHVSAVPLVFVYRDFFFHDNNF